MLCFIILIYKIYVLNNYDISILNTFPIRKYIPLGILRTLSISIIFVAISREIPGSLLIILLQLSIPISIIFSRFISSISYKSISRPHWTAIILIFFGTIFGFLSSFLGHLGSNYIDYNNNNKSINAWWYIPIVIVSCLIQSLFILYQEVKISPYHFQHLYPIELINGWISLIQCLFTFILSPILIYLSDPEILFWNDWYLFLHKGFLCLFNNSVNNTIYCPNNNIYTMIQFIIWILSSIFVLLLTHFIKNAISPLTSRFCLLFGFLFAFIGFQTGFPSFLIINGNKDYFDECLLLGILCSFVGSFMLLIDFNPNRSNTLLDSIQFDEINYSKKMQSQLLMLQKQHESLTMSQSQINININDNHHNNNKINNHHQSENGRLHSKSLSASNLYYGQTQNVMSDDDDEEEEEEEQDGSNYVCYLLMEQQKEIIKQEYQTKLKEFKRIERQRSQSFHEEFYSSPKRNRKDKKNKRKNKKKKKNKYYMNEQQIEEYYMLLQQEHQRRLLQQKHDENIMNDNNCNDEMFEASQFMIRNPLNVNNNNNNYHCINHTDSQFVK